MGFVQSLFGIDTGAGYQASGLTSNDLQSAAGGVQNQQQQQQGLLDALQGQNGIGNQSQVYNQQQQLLGQMGQNNGLGTQQSSIQALQGLAGQQQGTAQQYQDLANGVGANPAQAQLAQNTAANVAQTGALMAGQRGASQNVGLIARQAGQQGAQTQQQAAGQAATLQAQQQIAGLQGLAAQQQAIGGTNQSIAGIAGNQIGQLQGQQTNAANFATQLAGQRIAAQQQAGNLALGNQSNVYGLQSNLNTSNAGLAQANQKAQAGLIGGVLGSVGAGGSAASSGGGTSYAAGGMVQPQVQTPNAYKGPAQNPQGPQSNFGQFISNQGRGAMTQDAGTSGDAGGRGLYQIAKQVGKHAYQGAKSLFSEKPPELMQSSIYGEPDELYPSALYDDSGPTSAASGGGESASAGAANAAEGASSAEGAEAVGATAEAGEGAESLDALLFATGGPAQYEKGYSDTGSDPSTVGGTLQDIMQYLGAEGGGVKKNLVRGGNVKAGTPSQKATVKGNSYSNDKIPALLSEGEIVIPREVLQSGDPVNGSARFVAATLAKRRGGR